MSTLLREHAVNDIFRMLVVFSLTYLICFTFLFYSQIVPNPEDVTNSVGGFLEFFLFFAFWWLIGFLSVGWSLFFPVSLTCLAVFGIIRLAIPDIRLLRYVLAFSVIFLGSYMVYGGSGGLVVSDRSGQFYSGGQLEAGVLSCSVGVILWVLFEFGRRHLDLANY